MYQIYFILEWHSMCSGRSFRPSSGVQDCTYSDRHLSNRYCCLLASGYEELSSPLASRQQYLFDICLSLYVQSWTPDDGWTDCLLAVCTVLNSWRWTDRLSACCTYSHELLTMDGQTVCLLCVQSWTPDDGWTDCLLAICTVLNSDDGQTDCLLAVCTVLNSWQWMDRLSAC